MQGALEESDKKPKNWKKRDPYIRRKFVPRQKIGQDREIIPSFQSP